MLKNCWTHMFFQALPPPAEWKVPHNEPIDKSFSVTPGLAEKAEDEEYEEDEEEEVKNWKNAKNKMANDQLALNLWFPMCPNDCAKFTSKRMNFIRESNHVPLPIRKEEQDEKMPKSKDEARDMFNDQMWIRICSKT